jgi:hypothetical protein
MSTTEEDKLPSLRQTVLEMLKTLFHAIHTNIVSLKLIHYIIKTENCIEFKTSMLNIKQRI